MNNISAITDFYASENIPELTIDETVSVIENLFYQLYHVVAGEHGDPTDTCYSITSVHQDLLAIARGEL